MSMRRTDPEAMYNKLYRMFEKLTPVRADCGVLCDRACCRGDEDTGMLLFPYEKTPLPFVENNGRRLAVCGGACDRSIRPLSCRIFPLFPILDEKGKIEVSVDPRGAGLCPLVRQVEHVDFDPKFLKNVRKAGRILKKNPACRAFLREQTEEIEEVFSLQASL